MPYITALGSTSVLSIIVAGIVSYLVVTGLRHAAVMVAASVVSGVILSNSLKALFSRARPAFMPHDMVV